MREPRPLSRTAKKLLMIAFHYPPDMSSSGVLRTLKYSRYLPEHGWLPHVLTVDPKHYEVRDEALVGQIPAEVKVYRTRAVNTKSALSIRGRYLKAVTIPDRFIGWLPFAVAAALRVIRRERIEALYSTSPLATSHMIGAAVKKLTGLPWIADFRDPWTEPELVADHQALLFRLETRLEDLVLRRADRLVFTTGGLRAELLRRHPRAEPDKAVVIPNGYDEEDFESLEERPPAAPPLWITHAGLVDQEYRSPFPLFDAISELKRSGQLAPGQLRVDFLGGGAYLESDAFRQAVASRDLGEEIRVSGRVSYRESIERQARSHVLLILQCTDDTRHLIPAKAFEYLRVGRPILALAPESATSELFADVGGAEVVDPKDRPAIANRLLELVKRAEQGQLVSGAKQEALKNYSRRKLAERLGAVLDGVSRQGPAAV